MPTCFVATQFSVIEQDDVLTTTLGAPSTDDEDYYLTLQRGLSQTKQDVEFGMDKPYLEYCGQGWSWYGEIELFELFRNRVVARMSSRAASHMKNDGVIGAEFDLDAAKFLELQQSLERTFHGCSFFVVRS
jgi:hypothetical protein